MTTTNYYNTLIEVAEDCPVNYGEMPLIKKDKKSIARLQFDWLFDQPYVFSSDDVLFGVFAERQEFTKHQLVIERNVYFSKGQPCFRASPLTKRYGWGVHANCDGKIAIYSIESEAYKNLLKDDTVIKVKAMRSKRN